MECSGGKKGKNEVKKIFEEIMEINFPVLKSKFQIKWVYRASRKDIKKKNPHMEMCREI